MITFQQLCEHLTCNQKYAWFLFEHAYYSVLTDEEKTLVYINDNVDNIFFRLWYPRDKFYSRVVGKEEYQKLLQLALDKEDYKEVGKLKQMRII